MLILYAISVVSFCALVWAAFAITRHIRNASSATAPKPPETAPRATAAGAKSPTFANSKQPQAR